METATTVTAHSAVQTTESLFDVLLRRRRSMLIPAAVALLLAGVYLTCATQMYLSRSRLVVAATGTKLLGDGFDSGKSETYLNTQAELLRSAPIAIDALKRADSASLKIFSDVSDPVAWMNKNLQVQAGRNSDMVTVSLNTPYPDEGMLLVGAVVAAYMDYHTGQRRSTATGMLRILESQRDDRQAQLLAINEHLRQLEKSQWPGGENSAEDQIAALSEGITEAQLRRIDAESRYESARSVAAGVGGVSRLLEVEAGRGVIRFDREYEELQLQQSQLRANLSNMRQRLGDNHPSVRGVDANLQNIAAQMARKQQHMAMSHLLNLRSTYEAACRVDEQMRAALDEAREQMTKQQTARADLDRIRAEANRMAEKRDRLDQRISEMSVAEDAGAVEISIVEQAHTQAKPVSPQKAQVLGLALVMGLVMGVLLALGREWFDMRFRSVDELRAVLNLTVLGIIPKMATRGAAHTAGRIAHDDRGSDMAEAFRDLRTAFMFIAKRDNCSTLLVTSPAPNDGKSTVAGNLAITLAQAGKRVLLMDADLRRPTLHGQYAVACNPGLTSILNGHATHTDAIAATDIDRLHVLPAGEQVDNPSEILGGEAFMLLLDELAEAFDFVIVDSPPVCAATDARILAAQCDGAVLVMRPDRTDRREAALARDTLDSVGAKLLGVAVNAAAGAFAGTHNNYQYGYSRNDTSSAAAAPKNKTMSAVQQKELDPVCSE